MVCKPDDIIVKLELKLYNEFPDYKEYNTFLMDNGSIIKRFKTVEENGIKNGDTIIIYKDE